MRKLIFLLLTVILFAYTANAQYVNIPDSGFRQFLQTNYPVCFNSAGQMDTTCPSVLNLQTLTIRDNGQTAITNLNGLEYFKSLITLDCSYLFLLTEIPNFPQTLTTLTIINCAGLQSLPIMPQNLQYMNCTGSGLTSLPVFPATITYLDCSYNHLTSLQSLPENIEDLNCDGNRIPSIISLPARLKKLQCRFNQLQSLANLPDGLTELYCDYNQIANLPSLPLGLLNLNCEYNALLELPVLPPLLKVFVCSSNGITQLPSLPNSLTLLNCLNNRIETLPALPSSLENLDCSINQLTSLPPFPSTLKWVNCQNNQLSSLPPLPLGILYIDCTRNNIYCFPVIPYTPSQPVGSFTIYYDNSKISCFSNIPPSALLLPVETPAIFPIPLCNPTNNVNHCQTFPVISGNVFFDNNNNGIKDANEPYKTNLKFELSNGGMAYTNNNGYFEIGVDTLGTYTITPTAPNYYNIIPTSATYNFATYDTIVSKDYALQANTIIDSLAINITAIHRARPGFSFPYLISYENAGTTTLSPNIVFNYDYTRLIYDSNSNASVVNNDNSLSLSVGSLVPGQQGNFIAYFKVSPTATIGDSLLSKATASASSYQVADSNITIIRGSFDPNDKQATPQLSPSQVANGDYIDYTIRFQNTGTDTAFNIVISDTLSDDLQANTLEMLASSHNCKATVKDNIVFFEFLNILLPDSNVNELKSHGLVSFKIKPQTMVAVNSTVTNKAAIYFDYNAPVITNTASTLIKEFTVVPLKLVSFSAVPQNDNTTALYWNTANEINTKHFVIEKSNDGSKFNPVSNVIAKGKVNNSYATNVVDLNNSLVYYRLKIVDNDESFCYSPIIKIDRRKNAAGFSVLTNPVKDFFVISTTDRSLNNTQAAIINMQGAVINSFIVKEGIQAVEIKSLPAGVYYLRTVNGSSRILVQ